ncbi:related to 2-3-cyclic-nucleotide 3-phosphodiesterase [Rhynchosporium secalis]|uniref:Related to 2-3-cyclic-nucleotide 3-phosphodiesterase n=1 Tax=Rhynchosporium secalis TaxID=38038 RepID=A0A1E1MT48_RHYSE|nr:related to 2-3-cyclic-nucleotide 3-phosphodiesterase [Rhynchosporium secalis]
MASKSQDISNNKLSSTTVSRVELLAPLNNPSTTSSKVVVVGIYGLPGSGKTFLLNLLRHELRKELFEFYDGSEMIAKVSPGGLEAFQELEEGEKLQWRQLAIDTIRNECANSGRVAVVAGHFMFWPEEEEAARPVYTQNDLATFTHILYLDVPVQIVLQRRQGDMTRGRPSASLSHLSKWQEEEKTQLRSLCRNHGILFSLVSQQTTLLGKVSMLLRDFQYHTEEYNLSLAKRFLDESVVAGQPEFETVLVMDADRTLAAVDTGMLFWQKILASQSAGRDSPLKTLFGSSLGYSYTAFRQATLLYEEIADDEEFNSTCQEVALVVTMYPELVALLKLVINENHVGAVIISCGLRRVWEKVLEREGLSKAVKVIGGGRIADGFVVTARLKAALVARLQSHHQKYVWAFGDSLLDLEMLSTADQAIVVVGDEKTRSRTMDLGLFNVIRDGGLQARQVVLPSDATPRLDTNMLPLVSLVDPDFVHSILRHRSRQAGIQVHHATEQEGTKLLMTPMRDATFSGPALRESHRRVGHYLATGFLARVVGIEEFSIAHVQGYHTSGYRLLNEQKTSIVALMRGGEPMAFGVNDIFPLAMFVHASCPEDIKPRHLQGQSTVVLVDSVVNNGTTVVQFEKHIRRLSSTIRVVVIAGVVQAESVSDGSSICKLARSQKLDIIALRLSDNKFTGKGTTDTGNRLFNTTHMP